MKYQDEINNALTLINDDEKYIIFIDGKAINTNLTDDDCQLTVNDNVDTDDYYRRQKSKEENEILDNIDYASTILLNNNLDLKIIHLNHERKYIAYNIIVNDNIEVNITNIYYAIQNEVKIKLEFICEVNSKVHLKTFTNCNNHVHTIANAYCLDNAYITLDDLFLNNESCYHQANVFLINSGAEANMTNVIVNACGKEQEFDYNVYHIGDKTTSRINNYGISNNNSILSFNNKGIINKNAVSSNLSQQTKGIILDMYSQIIAKPILEINENDVMANHGASIGAIDERDLYYLMSRGLTREDSEALLVAAFISPYFRHLDDEKLKNYIFNEVNKILYK
ncbi:MAG TPA: SufD family Fe-S cluster assembly protein [Bacilli bacterium]